MYYNDECSTKPDFFFIVGNPGSGKTYITSKLLDCLDIDVVHKECPCISDSIRQIYIIGRYKDYHGPSTKNLDDGTDRMFAGVDTSIFVDFIKKIVYDKRNIVICEGISKVLCNVSTMNKIRDIGFKINIIELATPSEISINNLIRRNDYNEKTKKMQISWERKKKLLKNNFPYIIKTQDEVKNIILLAISKNNRKSIYIQNYVNLDRNKCVSIYLNVLLQKMMSVQIKSQQIINKKNGYISFIWDEL